ncbi:MAG: hypothetical protein KGR26_14975, partial [Cyanobacteria bacterium REEB65]|nr:hypothetical protein [Cyanobacteria bacterium REEB65]
MKFPNLVALASAAAVLAPLPAFAHWVSQSYTYQVTVPDYGWVVTSTDAHKDVVSQSVQASGVGGGASSIETGQGGKPSPAGQTLVGAGDVGRGEAKARQVTIATEHKILQSDKVLSRPKTTKAGPMMIAMLFKDQDAQHSFVDRSGRRWRVELRHGELLLSAAGDEPEHGERRRKARQEERHEMGSQYVADL